LTKEQLKRQKEFIKAAKTIIGAGQSLEFQDRTILESLFKYPERIPQTPTGTALELFQKSPTRANALAYLNGLDGLKKSGKITKEIATLYKDHISDLRGIYGYEDISQVPEDSGLPLSIPYWSNEGALRSYQNDTVDEFRLYEQANETVRGISKYPKLNELLRKLAIPPEQQILSEFFSVQQDLLRSK